jgi:hypothetical protein
MEPNKLETRLRILEDTEEIKKLHLTYMNSLIKADWDAVDECFAENCATEFPGTGVQRGKAEVSKYFREHVARSHIGKEGVFAVHPIITVAGDKATGNWFYYSLRYQPREHPPEMKEIPDWVQGIYDMEYVKENGKWRISLLRWNPRLRSISKPAK